MLAAIYNLCVTIAGLVRSNGLAIDLLRNELADARVEDRLRIERLERILTDPPAGAETLEITAGQPIPKP